MKKEEILEASRKEHKNSDPADIEISRFSGNIAFSVGAFACALVSLLSSAIGDMMLYSPWAIYFSMMCANWLVRAIKQRKITHWALAVFFVILAVLAFIGLVTRLAEVNV